jgi:hypothetical protein
MANAPPRDEVPTVIILICRNDKQNIFDFGA